MPPHHAANDPARMTTREALSMSVLADEPRAVRLEQLSFEAFRVTDGGRTYPLDFAEGSTLKEIVESAKVHCFHKDHLLIRETDRSGANIPERLGGGVCVKLHLYAIKRKSAPRYVYENHVQRRVHDLYADAVCVIDGVVL